MRPPTSLPVVPVVNRASCEGKAACEAVCPEQVFEITTMTDEDFEALGFLAKVKSRLHRRRTAYVIAGDQCTGCGECVTACPERAIELHPRA